MAIQTTFRLMNTNIFKKQILSPSGKPDSPICCVTLGSRYELYSFTQEALQMNESSL